MQIESSTQTSPALQHLPRLGQISFVNALPVVFPIQSKRIDLAAEMVLANPDQLNKAFAAGSLDIGAMSSFFYLSQPDFELVPDLSIACRGAVGSVLFFSRSEAGELSNKRVAVAASSATSVALLKILLRETAGVTCNFVADSDPDLDDPSWDGALVIGDQALLVDQEWSAKFKRRDLGEWWHDYTGLPMVFGVWAARSDWADSHRQSFEHIAKSLVKSASLGLSDMLCEVVAEAALRTGLSEIRLMSYYTRELNYQLSNQHLEALQTFKRLCIAHQLLG